MRLYELIVSIAIYTTIHRLRFIFKPIFESSERWTPRGNITQRSAALP